MTLRTEWEPEISRALAATKLDRVVDAYFFRVFAPETLQLLTYLVAFKCYNLKLLLKSIILCFKLRRMKCKLRRAVLLKRKALCAACIEKRGIKL